jgi:4-alpha-glucanotransferase
MKRIGYCFELYDVVRIDHFRGFDEYYSIPYGDKTAEYGHWEKGPGMEFFQVMKEKLGERKVIAEDLGFLTDSVIELVRQTGFPGMKVLQFAFDSREESDYLPHNYIRNSIVYTGTHDNDTTAHWFSVLNEADKRLAIQYMNLKQEEDACSEMIRMAFGSVADTCVIPMQDYLELGEEARINEPSTLGKNWKWRLTGGECTDELAKHIRRLTGIYGR